MPYKIRIDTLSDAHEFASAAAAMKESIVITDGQGLRVNAKSILGVLYALEFNELYCETDGDLHHRLQRFVID